MPRDPAGNFSLYTPGNPVVSGTTIASAWANNTLSDLGAAMTDSLSRSGLGGMLAPFRLVDGSVTVPAFAFQSENNTGIYRAGAADVRLAIGGADAFEWTGTGLVANQPFKEGFEVVATAAHNGIKATSGTGVVSGLWGIAGTSSGFGVSGLGVSGGLGGLFSSSSSAVDVMRIDGYVDLSHATNPTSTTGFANRVTPKNVAKAWALIHVDGVGGVTVQDGFNIASVAIGIVNVTVTFATALSSNLYSATASAHAGQALSFLPHTKTTSTLVFNVSLLTSPGTPLNPTVSAFDVDLAIYGVQ